MKKRFLISIILLLIFAAFFSGGFLRGLDTAFAADPEYARVVSDSAMLYRTKSGSLENENNYFLLPKGYYVFLDDTSDPVWYKVTYDIFSGYVKAEDVDIVSYTPKLKYAAGQLLKIETPDGGSCNLREYPVKTAAKLIEAGIPDETPDIKFYNYLIIGEDRWYFVEFGGQRGYIFGAYAVITAPIAVNDGAAEPVQTTPDPNGGTTPEPLDITTVIILVAVIGIPALIIIIMLFKPRRRRPRYSAPRKESRRVPKYLDEEEHLPPY